MHKHGQAEGLVMSKKTRECWVGSQLNRVSISDASGIAERRRERLFIGRMKSWGAFVPPQPRKRRPNDCSSCYRPNGSGEGPIRGRIC